MFKAPWNIVTEYKKRYKTGFLLPKNVKHVLENKTQPLQK